MTDDTIADDHESPWHVRAASGDYRASRTKRNATDGDGNVVNDDVIRGMLPRTGASVWFGEGSVGKTQLLLWLAVHLASDTATGPAEWLGRPVQRRGQVLVVSAEDLGEHLVGRLDSIIQGMQAAYPGLDADRVRDRIHLLPFLSLSEAEFAGSNPTLFKRRRPSRWQPSKTLRRIEEFITLWNSEHADDPIIGVIVDSAVSLSGFDLANADATTNFLFHLNRQSRRQDVFWAIIGHVVKAGRGEPKDPDAGAVSRLRGAAMWSTTPRTVVEVRFPVGDEDADVRKAVASSPDRREILYVTVVKGNNQGTDYARRVLRRGSEIYDDITASFRMAVKEQPSDAERIDAVLALIRELTEGGAADTSIVRSELNAAFEKARKTVPALAQLKLAHGRGANTQSLTGILAILKERGAVRFQTTDPVRVVDLDAV